MININGNLTNMSSFNDIVKAYAIWTGKKSTAAKYNSALEAATSAGFYAFADSAARDRKDELNHVYDYAKGNKLGRRLFRLITRGGATNKEMFYIFLRSTKSVPRGTTPDDTRKTAHVFIWKAPVLESGKGVRPIRPVMGGVLAFPATQANIDSMGKMTRYTIRNGMIFTKGPVHPHPTKNKGKFGALWLTYWGGIANNVAISLVQKPTEYRLRTQLPSTIKKAMKGARFTSKVSRVGFGRYEQTFDRTADQILSDAHALYAARIQGE